MESTVGGSCRVLLVDDHVMFRQGLRALLEEWPELTIVGEASNGWEAHVKARDLKPDVILMDIKMPECDGLSAITNIKSEMPHIRIVVLTTDGGDSTLILDALRRGALGFVSKMGDVDELVRAIRLVGAGEAAISTPALTSLISTLSSAVERTPTANKPRTEHRALDGLSSRERQVLDLIGEGLSNREIARILCITESTAHSHVHSILEKLQVTNRVQAAVYVRAARQRNGSREPDSDQTGRGTRNGRASNPTTRDPLDR